MSVTYDARDGDAAPGHGDGLAAFHRGKDLCGAVSELAGSHLHALHGAP
ncbi:hypothetical protein P376_1421 [Streptomyces sp. HCCB10043]|uniref:Predicted protein n=1 Tax=Streptomyces filamentosus NRRL 15998 TaxID=457431 RepID=D6AM25_STRFL|nr:predicted protein [Streptomyces filamentosus NRRL 15998]ESU50605.1 hypothetical protein P376_1421 [Streptomyces sp. HCCB10043]